jgi:hypothetical protein
MSTQPSTESVGAGAGDPLAARLVVAYNADSMVIRGGSFASGATSVVQTAIQSRPFLLGLEVFGPNGFDGPAARTRFAVRPPQPLSAMTRGEIAVSDPAFLMPPDVGQSAVAEPHEALARLLPNTTFTRGGRIGLYWEVYGADRSDAIRLSIVAIHGRDTIALAPHTLPGRLLEGSAGDVPVLSYNLTLNLTPFEPGDYTLEVRAALGSDTATGRRSLRIVRGDERVERVVVEEAPLGPSEEQWVNSLVAVGRKVNPGGSPVLNTSRDELSLMIADSLGFSVPKTGRRIGGDSRPHITMSVLNPTTEVLYVNVLVTWPGQKIRDASCWAVRHRDGRWIPERVTGGSFFTLTSINNPVVDCQRISER